MTIKNLLTKVLNEIKKNVKQINDGGDPRLENAKITIVFLAEEVVNYESDCDEYADKIKKLFKEQLNPASFLKESLLCNPTQRYIAYYSATKAVPVLKTPYGTMLLDYLDRLNAILLLLEENNLEVCKKIATSVEQYRFLATSAIIEKNKKLYDQLAQELLDQSNSDTQAQQINNNNTAPNHNSQSRTSIAMTKKRSSRPTEIINTDPKLRKSNSGADISFGTPIRNRINNNNNTSASINNKNASINTNIPINQIGWSPENNQPSKGLDPYFYQCWAKHGGDLRLLAKSERGLMQVWQDQLQRQQINNNNAMPNVNRPNQALNTRLEKSGVKSNEIINNNNNTPANITNNNASINTNNPNNETYSSPQKISNSYRDIIGVRSAHFKNITVKTEPKDEEKVDKNRENNLTN